jgi:hypothetical protein
MSTYLLALAVYALDALACVDYYTGQNFADSEGYTDYEDQDYAYTQAGRELESTYDLIKGMGLDELESAMVAAGERMGYALNAVFDEAAAKDMEEFM